MSESQKIKALNLQKRIALAKLKYGADNAEEYLKGYEAARKRIFGGGK